MIPTKTINSSLEYLVLCKIDEDSYTKPDVSKKVLLQNEQRITGSGKEKRKSIPEIKTHSNRNKIISLSIFLRTGYSKTAAKLSFRLDREHRMDKLLALPDGKEFNNLIPFTLFSFTLVPRCLYFL